jgi:hypothetical protein
MDQHLQLVVHSVATQPLPPPFRQSIKADTFPRSLSESIDSGNLAFVRREDTDYASDYSHFGCVRLLVWAFVFEGALVIAISAYWWRPRLIR